MVFNYLTSSKKVQNGIRSSTMIPLCPHKKGHRKMAFSILRDIRTALQAEGRGRVHDQPLPFESVNSHGKRSLKSSLFCLQQAVQIESV